MCRRRGKLSTKRNCKKRLNMRLARSRSAGGVKWQKAVFGSVVHGDYIMINSISDWTGPQLPGWCRAKACGKGGCVAVHSQPTCNLETPRPSGTEGNLHRHSSTTATHHLVATNSFCQQDHRTVNSPSPTSNQLQSQTQSNTASCNRIQNDGLLVSHASPGVVPSQTTHAEPSRRSSVPTPHPVPTTNTCTRTERIGSSYSQDVHDICFANHVVLYSPVYAVSTNLSSSPPR